MQHQSLLAQMQAACKITPFVGTAGGFVLVRDDCLDFTV